ncbi:phosphate-selective porin O and P [Thermodesulfobacterium geofontis OPF15]|uniref:Phosphate-selective porin O and P n=1 Tax=Thermodesulfobacterium geofontis (strain OPF15) TaxID=795359 RepID=F8C5L7_THEGP|nr:porin [Thermodesulfobacterium geofontis]AEH22996.1 phosphate-selective porin O and P [Thermodesulfobacterium geofontis OPF15]
MKKIVKKLKKKALLTEVGLASAILFTTSTNAAPTFTFGEGQELEIFFCNQLWAIYTMDRVENGTKYDNRWDFFLRRSRLGFQGKISENLSWRVWFAYDNVGMDPHTAITNNNNVGLVNYNVNNREFYIWDAMFTYALHKNWANITIGYFRPQVGRESITAGFEVPSLEKALANFYPRMHLVGTGPGRETGINIGGLYNDEKRKWGINYNFGVFNVDKFSGDKGGDNLLYTGRVAITLGDPEMKKYTLGYKVNYFGKRNGITFAINYAYQGRAKPTISYPLAADIWYTLGNSTKYFDPKNSKLNKPFKNNQMIGFDILANYKNFTFNAEYDVLKRNFDESDFNYDDKVWHIRIGYNFVLPNKTILEPAITYQKWEGDKNSLNGDGELRVIDIGLNWYIKENKLKLSIHYVDQDGSARSAYNSYNPNIKMEKGAAGDYIGVGLQLIF